jgi:hypothetical protein
MQFPTNVSTDNKKKKKKKTRIANDSHNSNRTLPEYMAVAFATFLIFSLCLLKLWIRPGRTRSKQTCSASSLIRRHRCHIVALPFPTMQIPVKRSFPRRAYVAPPLFLRNALCRSLLKMRRCHVQEN